MSCCGPSSPNKSNPREGRSPDPAFNPVAYALIINVDVEYFRVTMPSAVWYNITRTDLPLCDADLTKVCDALGVMGMNVVDVNLHNDPRGTTGTIRIQDRAEGVDFEPARYALTALR